MFVLVQGKRWSGCALWNSLVLCHIGLQCLLYQAAQCDPSLYLGKSGPSLPSDDVFKSLECNMSGDGVASLADKVVSLHESTVLEHVNTAFEAWRATWDLRNHRERGHEDRTFFNDPLPLWWLGKLYMILYCHSHNLPPESEFSTWKAARKHDEREKLQIKAKTRRWMARFRDIRHQPQSSTRHYLSKVLRFSEVESIG